MDSGSRSDEQSKRKRGRPRGTRRGEMGQNKPDANYERGLADSTTNGPSQDTSLSAHSQLHLEPSSPDELPRDTTRLNLFNTFLQNLIHQDRTEIERAARELEVTENTIYRWMNGISVPRATYLKKLPDVFPEQRTQLISLIKQVFGDVANTLTPTLQELPKEIYIRVLNLAANSEDEEARMWQVSQAIFEYALLHMDPERLGLMVTYARLMRPHSDGIHSLYEVSRRSNDPCLITIEATAFLGSTSLAGRAAIMQRLQVWHLTNTERALVETDEFAQSSCAVPVQRDSLLAGVLIFSSVQPDFFRNSLACQIASEFALLMAVAHNDKDFHSSSRLNLRPMPDLEWQRKHLVETYVDRVIIYARRHAITRREAELQIQCEMELEFEEMARKMLEQRQKEVLEVQAMPQQAPDTSSLR